MPEMQISKLDAAKRQLDSALRMFFADDDPVSIHTLTAAAHEVLRDIGRLQGIPSFVKDIATQMIVDEHRQEYITAVNEAENFFKHADRDPNGLLTFRLRQTEYLLLDALAIYQQITGEITVLNMAFNFWFKHQHPGLMKDEEQAVIAEVTKTIPIQGKQSYLRMAGMVDEFRRTGKVTGIRLV